MAHFEFVTVFAPKKKRCEYKETAEERSQMPGRHGKSNATSEIAAQEHAQRAQNAGAQINLSVLPVFAKRAQTDRRKKDEKRSALREMLVHVQQMDHGRNEDNATADAEQSDKNASRQTNEKDDEDHEGQRGAILLDLRIWRAAKSCQRKTSEA